MRAAIFHEQGGPEVLRYEDVPTPSPSSGEVLVRVRAAALNRLDLKARENRPEVTPYPHIGGLDAAGEIAALGADVPGFAVGENVVIYPVLSCGTCRFCMGGEPALCAEQRVFGFQTQGGFAEYVVVPASNLVRVARSSLERGEADMRTLAAAPTVYLTAWHMLIERARLRPSETVLVHSVGSGVGSAALQIAKLFGAKVVGTAGSQEKLARARELGADLALSYRNADTYEAVMDFTKGIGADVVVETVGADTWETSLRCAAKNGRVVTCGVTSGSLGATQIRHLYQRQVTILGSVIGGKAELESIVALILGGRLHPPIAKVFPLREIAEAHRALESRELFGKIALDVD